VIKANQTENFAYSIEQKQYLGSGIGALEECLKQSSPEFLSRIYYYLGFAYNNMEGALKMPLKAISYWQAAKKRGFNTPIQGLKKKIQVQKFVDKFEFIDLILELINSSFQEFADSKSLS